MLNQVIVNSHFESSLLEHSLQTAFFSNMFSNERAVRTLPFNHSARAISFKPFVKPARQTLLQKFPPKVPFKPSVKTMPSVAILDRALCCLERIHRAAMEQPGPGLGPEGLDNPIDDDGLMIPKSLVKTLLGKRKMCPQFKNKMLGSAFQRARVCRSSYASWYGILTHYCIFQQKLVTCLFSTSRAWRNASTHLLTYQKPGRVGAKPHDPPAQFTPGGTQSSHL